MSCHGHKGATLALIAVTLGLGCGTEEIGVGDAVVRLNLADCYGEGTHCEGFDVSSRLLSLAPLTTCPDSVAPPRTIAWYEQPYGDQHAFAVAPDGTFWVIGKDPGGFAVERFDRAGRVLEPVHIDVQGENFDAFVEALSVDVDSRGHGFIGLNAFFTRQRGWSPQPRHIVIELDDQGVQIGEHIEIDGIREGLLVAIGADDELLITGIGDGGVAVLARLNSDRSMRWVQIGLRQASVQQLEGDEAGRTLVYGRAASHTPFAFDDSVALYDDQGNLVWDRRPGTTSGVLARRRDGSFTILGNGPAPHEEGMEPTDYGNMFVSNLDDSGEQGWSVQLPIDIQIASGQAYADDEGNAYFCTVSGRGPEVYRFDRNGECEQRTIAAPDGNVDFFDVSALYGSPQGVTFFAGESAVGVISP